jgi:predicted membrane protein
MSPVKEEEKPTARVEELTKFPFTTFQGFRDAHRDGRCYVAVDRSVALSWAYGGHKYSTRSLSFFVAILAAVPYFAVIGFVVYSILSRSWLLLLALPAFVFAHLFFHPSMRFAGILRSVPIWLSVLGFIWGVAQEWFGLIAITGVLLVIWLSHLAVDKWTTSRFTRVLTEHEDFLCAAWRNRAMAIQFGDGRMLFVDSQSP